MSWTAADAAEQDVLIHQLANSYFDHAETCQHCQAWQAKNEGSLPCPHVRNAINIVLEWRQKRELLTRAENLRHLQTARTIAA